MPGTSASSYYETWSGRSRATVVELGLDVGRPLARQAEDQVDPEPGSALPPGGRRRGSGTSPARPALPGGVPERRRRPRAAARRPPPGRRCRADPGPRAGGRRSSARRATHAAAGPPPRPRTRGVTSSGFGLDRHLGPRREERLERLQEPLEPLLTEQRRRAAAHEHRLEAAHAAALALAPPLLGHRVDEAVEQALAARRPRPPARAAAGDPRAARDRATHRHRGELAVVAALGAERHVDVEVARGGGGVRRRRPRRPPQRRRRAALTTCPCPRRRARAPPGTPPGAPRRCRSASCASCLPSAFRGACACG